MNRVARWHSKQNSAVVGERQMQILWHSSHWEAESKSSLLKSRLCLMTYLANGIWWKWHSGTSEAESKKIWGLLTEPLEALFFGALRSYARSLITLLERLHGGGSPNPTSCTFRPMSELHCLWPFSPGHQQMTTKWLPRWSHMEQENLLAMNLWFTKIIGCNKNDSCFNHEVLGELSYCSR